MKIVLEDPNIFHLGLMVGNISKMKGVKIETCTSPVICRTRDDGVSVYTVSVVVQIAQKELIDNE